jgi:hypothetical protein
LNEKVTTFFALYTGDLFSVLKVNIVFIICRLADQFLTFLTGVGHFGIEIFDLTLFGTHLEDIKTRIKII